MRPILTFIKRVYETRAIIWIMAIRTIQNRYVGTLGGMAWALLQPLIMIVVYWFVFSVGFRVKPPGGVPFIIVFLCGQIPWATFNETLMANVYGVTGNAHLVKKTVFPTEILPLVNLLAGFIGHVIMIGILAVILFLNGVSLSFYSLQFFYYLTALSAFTLGLSWLLAAFQVFYRDVAQILGALLPLWFWLTPIVWFADMLPPKYLFLLRLNPLTYIVDGYKDSFIYHSPFWAHPLQGIYFWAVSVILLFVGAFLFRRLKPLFAEVL